MAVEEDGEAVPPVERGRVGVCGASGDDEPVSFWRDDIDITGELQWELRVWRGTKGESRKRTVSVGTFPANGFGLHDVHGNVWEWVEDCWNKNYAGAPADGSAWLSGHCSKRVLRGGTLSSRPRDLRAANRNWFTTGFRFIIIGFRVARTLSP